MTSSNFPRALRWLALGAAGTALALLVAACGGGGGGSSSSSSSSGSSTITQEIASCEAGLATTSEVSANQMDYVIDQGPCASTGTTSSSTIQEVGTFNAPFTTVTICVPGTSTCATIDHVLVDTGSSGLRIMSSVLPSGFSLPAETSNSVGLYECVQFGSGFSWGSVRAADVKIAGESTTSAAPSGIPVHIIGDSGENYPSACSSGYPSGTTAQDTVASFGANGILGVGLFINDCGVDCETANASGCNSTSSCYNFYYACTSTNSSADCSSVAMTSTQQVSNPVSYFGTDNNGVILTTNAVGSTTGGESRLSGTLTFGVNTENNNYLTTTAYGGLVAYATDAAGNFNSNVTAVGSTSVPTNTSGDSCEAAYLGTSTGAINYYAPCSFVDSGSNAVYFPFSGSTTPSMAVNKGWFAPSSSTVVAADMYGNQSGASLSTATTYSYTVNNATTLFGLGSGTDAVLMGLAAPNSVSGLNTSGVDWGFPFFYGRSIVVVIEANGSSNTSITYPYPSGTAYSTTTGLWIF